MHFIRKNLAQRIKMKRNNQKCQFLGEKSRKSFSKFAEHVGPHGLTYIIRFVWPPKMILCNFSKEIPSYRRAFWSLVFILGLSYSFYMCFRNGTRYFNHPSIIKPTTVKYFLSLMKMKTRLNIRIKSVCRLNNTLFSRLSPNFPRRDPEN